jgi:hypothetical protein
MAGRWESFTLAVRTRLVQAMMPTARVGFEVEDFRLQKPDDGSEHLEQNDDEQQVV